MSLYSLFVQKVPLNTNQPANPMHPLVSLQQKLLWHYDDCNCSVVANEDVGALQSWYSAGVDFSLADYNGRTALHVAVAHGRTDHVAYLLEHGANPRAVDVNGFTPLDEAQKQSLTEIVAQLKITSNNAPADNGESSNK